jgi:predicted transporter
MRVNATKADIKHTGCDLVSLGVCVCAVEIAVICNCEAEMLAYCNTNMKIFLWIYFDNTDRYDR